MKNSIKNCKPAEIFNASVLATNQPKSLTMFHKYSSPHDQFHNNFGITWELPNNRNRAPRGQLTFCRDKDTP